MRPPPSKPRETRGGALSRVRARRWIVATSLALAAVLDRLEREASDNVPAGSSGLMKGATLTFHTFGGAGRRTHAPAHHAQEVADGTANDHPTRERVVHRAGWELYNLRVSARRFVLDRAFSRRRRRRLLDASKVFLAGSDVIYAVAAPIGIEPLYGYLTRGRSAIIEDALMGSLCARMRSERHAFSGVPTLRQLTEAKRDGQLLANPIISLRHVFGSNHYHAVVDCVGALALLDEHADLADVPIVVDAELRKTSVMRAVVDAGLIDPARLIVQGDVWLGSEASISFVEHDPLSERSLRRTNAYLGRLVSPNAAPSNSRLYVARGVHSSGRALRNEPALLAELERRGYESIDPGKLSWEEQYHRFRAATHIVGVHGAALTNILFRAPDQLALLELTPPDHRVDVFQTMAHELGYRFHRLEGADRSPGGTRPSFVIDIDRVLTIVDDWDRCNAGVGS